MQAARIAVSLLFICLSGSCFAQAQNPPGTDSFKNEALVFEKSETTYRMHADGTGERDVHVVLRIQSQGAAQQFGVLAFGYAAAYETPTIKLVRVHKADGTVVDTPPSDAIDMATEVSREAPLYSDLKEKHLPVRSLAAGDTLEYELDTAIDKAEAPGAFWGVYHFTAPGTIVVLNETLTLEVPADKYVQVWSPNHKPTETTHDGLKTYVWNAAQLVTAPKSTGDDTNKPKPPKDPDEDADGKKLPGVAWTTFHNWAEVGDWYRSLALSRAQPDDAVKARAADLTKDAKTPEEQVRAIYAYVSQHNRYVGIDFGIGRYQPHGAAEVMANQYGDCKDKDTLLEALLHAKGFATAPALIGVGIAPVPEVPSPAVFNHVITTVNLPSGSIWLDSTPPGAPFQYLVAAIRDQKALVIPADGAAALQTTPAAGPYPFTAHFEADATLDKEGKLTGKITSSYRDDDEFLVRTLALNLAPADWDKGSQYVSAMTGFGGTTSNTQFEHANDISVPIELKYDYTKHPYGDWKMLNIVPLLPMPDFTMLESDSEKPEADIQLGAPRTLTAVSRIHLPEGFTATLPDPVHVKTDFATVDQVYRYDGKTVTTERTITILKEKIPKDDWKKYQAFTKDIHLNEEIWIPLMAPASAASPKADHAAQPSVAGGVTTMSPPPPDVMKKGPDAIRAYVEQEQARKAVPSLQQQAADHPDEVRYVLMLGAAQKRSGEADVARQTVQKFVDAHPSETIAAEYLASLETDDGDFGTALHTLQAAAAKNPDDRALQLNISEAQRRMGRNEDAAATAMNVLSATDDPALENNGAYTLSEIGLHLDVAEAASRRSVAALEAKTTTIAAPEANLRTFADANLLIAGWDTLGWILFEEGKPEAAKPYISAAWRASLLADVGDHLAQIDEAMGQKDEAAKMYSLAEAAINNTTQQETKNHIHNMLARLQQAETKPGEAGATALQNLRTYKVARPAAVSGWGTFRLIVTVTGVAEAQQMSGDTRVAAMKDVLMGLKFPELLPPDSKAHLLRSAVVSCSGSPCDVVLVPDGSPMTERQ